MPLHLLLTQSLPGMESLQAAFSMWVSTGFAFRGDAGSVSLGVTPFSSSCTA